MGRNKASCALTDLSTAIGAGILAGLAGTAAITMSQMIEMRITRRRPDTSGPVTAVENTLDVQPRPGTEKQMSQKIHWTYGTSWGLIRGLMGFLSISPWLATPLHYSAITGTAMAIAPLEDQPPVTEWDSKQVTTELCHHAVYALVASLVFEALYQKKR